MEIDEALENINQVEVIKGGPISALYGSSVLNGIINIRTAFPKPQKLKNIHQSGTQKLIHTLDLLTT